MGLGTVTVDYTNGHWTAYTRHVYLGVRSTYAALRARLDQLGVRTHTATPDAFDELERLAASER